MRTTVTLEPDAERLLRADMQRRGVSFKRALNDAVRAGLAGTASHAKRRFSQKTCPLGPVENFDCDKALALACALDDLEIERMLSRGE